MSDNSAKPIVLDVVPVDGDVLTFDETLQAYVPRAPSGGGTPSVAFENNVGIGTGLDYQLDKNSIYSVGTEFVAAATQNVGNLIVTRMSKTLFPNLNLVAKLYAGPGPTDGTEFDAENLLATSAPVVGSSLLAGGGSKAFTFTEAVEVTLGETYCIVIEVLDSVLWDGTNFPEVWMQASGAIANLKGGLSEANDNTWTFEEANDTILFTLC